MQVLFSSSRLLSGAGTSRRKLDNQITLCIAWWVWEYHGEACVAKPLGLHLRSSSLVGKIPFQKHDFAVHKIQALCRKKGCHHRHNHARKYILRQLFWPLNQTLSEINEPSEPPINYVTRLVRSTKCFKLERCFKFTQDPVDFFKTIQKLSSSHHGQRFSTKQTLGCRLYIRL